MSNVSNEYYAGRQQLGSNMQHVLGILANRMRGN